MTQHEQLALEAMQNLSNYEGSDIGYDGTQDDLLDFEGLHSFASEIEQSRVYQFSVRNNGPSPAKVYINKGYTMWGSGGLAGQIIDGSFGSANEPPYATMSCFGTGITSTLGDFRAFFFFNPVRVVGMKISAPQAQIENMALKFKIASPFKDLGEKVIYPSTFVNEQTWKDNIVTVPIQFDLNNQMVIHTTINPNTTVTFTMVIGGILNTSAALERKASKAQRLNVNVHQAMRGKEQVMFGNGRPGASLNMKMLGQ